MHKPVKITVSDPDTGEVLEERIVANDYYLLTAGNRYVKNIRVMGSTHMIAVAVDKASATTRDVGNGEASDE